MFFESPQMDYVMFLWFEPITFHLILHIQRFLVITNRDFYGITGITHKTEVKFEYLKISSS